MRILFAMTASRIADIVTERDDQSYEREIIRLLSTHGLFTHLGVSPELLFTSDFLCIPNSRYLQGLWHRERISDCDKRVAQNLEDILECQISVYQPDVIFTNNVRLAQSLSEAHSTPVALWLAAPVARAVDLRRVRIGLSFNDDYRALLRERGVEKVAHFDFSMDVRNKITEDGNNRRVDVGFYGRHSLMFRVRNRLLLSVARGVEPTLCVEYRLFHERGSFRRQPVSSLFLEANWRRLGRWMRPAVFGEQLWKYLSEVKVILNAHSDSTGIRKGNMRLFEAISAGAAVVCDKGQYPEGLHEVLEPWMFRSPKEAVEMSERLAAAPELRVSYVRELQKALERSYSVSEGRKRLDGLLATHL